MKNIIVELQAAARQSISQARERVSAIDIAPYVERAEGYKVQAIELASQQWERLSATPAGPYLKVAQKKVNELAKRFS
jgi:serine protease inhibitor ecotin